MLLQWCTLSPAGPSKLSAIRFSSPSRVHAIKIFPTDVQPFSQCPDIIARTEPEAFFLDVYFNAQPVGSPVDVKHKLKAPNALMPTVIPYAGGIVEYAVNMGSEFATRLMIVRGDFETVSMAIYGDVVSDIPPNPNTYSPLSLPTHLSVPLVPALDAAKSNDPTALARNLLALIPNAPCLSLVIRLMFCLKQPNDDWELPEFPHLYSDLNEEEMDIDLDTAFRSLSRPVVDDISSEQLHCFAKKVSDAIGPRDDAQTDLIAGILSRSASQTPEFAQALMQALDLETIFDASTLDEDALFTLLDASTNPDISRLLKAPWFLHVLRAVLALPTVTPEMKKACRRLSDRVGSWTVFEQALSGAPDADYTRAALFLKDIGKEEKSFGIWLSCITTHDDLLSKIRDAPAYEGMYPLDLMSGLSPSEDITHSEFMAFVRAYVGVASVLAVYAWSDSLPNLHCRERTLGVLRLWQEIPGYRAIISPLLLLPQMTFRLECMTTGNDPPTTAGINAESLLFALAANPQSFLNPDFVRCVRGWEPWSLTWINERERADIERAAKLADEGVGGAVEELVGFAKEGLDAILNQGRIRTLRVAVAVIMHALEDNTESGTKCGDWTVLEAVWGEHTHGLLNYAIDMFTRISVEVKQGFSLKPSPSPTIGLEPLFLVSNEILHLIACLHALSITTSRAVRLVVSGILDMYSCADVASHEFIVNSAVRDAAFLVKHACANVLYTFSRSSQDQHKCGLSAVLRTLFEQGLYFDNVDPARRLLSAFSLVLRVLSDDVDSLPAGWMVTVIPQTLTPLTLFFRHLEPAHKVQLVQRLVSLDHGILGLGDFLVQGEVKRLAGLLKVMAERGVVAQWEVGAGLEFVAGLVEAEDGDWCIAALRQSELGTIMTGLLDVSLYSKHLGTIAGRLAENPESLGIELRLSVVAALLRGVQVQESSICRMNAFGLISAVLETTDEKDRDPERLLWEVGHALAAVVESNDNLSSLDSESVVNTLLLLDSPSQSDLHGLTPEQWVKLCTHLETSLPPNMLPMLPIIKGFHPSPSPLPTITLLPSTLTLPLYDLISLLQPPATLPSTPPPKRKSPSQDVLGLVAISPPTAVLRSPAVTGLTKTYTRNDFRELRQLPSARQNTSRLPSMHVDTYNYRIQDFLQVEMTSSPLVQPVATAGDMSNLSPPFNMGKENGYI
ncbi:hypothetical protein DEU56DRAFT_902989 [Suillus clintonianus]|uniref:uncharacterized protein n=1 Tax=Suillus clintonianus TaxID=1904413 RepID=UPI001B87A27B|nr:uncharacterized protein DEU56DRAFT_902989 [Suillus clintonianus]KAG2128995.1 hypothetical protein DEU56DRAFT_902989 [Suillus clintonianus]